MTDTELIALAALVNAYAVETEAANAQRERNGQAPMYSGFSGPDEMKSLQDELERRGVIKH